MYLAGTTANEKRVIEQAYACAERAIATEQQMQWMRESKRVIVNKMDKVKIISACMTVFSDATMAETN